MVVLGGIGIAGCTAPSSTDPEAERSIAAVAAMPAAIEFRVVGTDGGPIDEPEPAGEALSVADAVRRAVTTDPGLQSALARVRIAAADADQARLLRNPVLDVVLRWGPGRPEIEAALAQPFVELLQRPRRASAADHRLRGAAADAVTTALDVVSEVQERYVAAQAAGEQRPLLEARRTLVERLVSIAKARLDAGEGTRADLITLDAQRVEVEIAIDQALLDERTSRLQVARLIGEPSSPAAWRLDPWTVPPADPRSELDWIDAALGARPEIQSRAWRLKALGDDEALIRWFPWEGAAVGIDGQRGEDWTVGPSLSTPLPLFDSGEAKRARLTAEQLELRHDLTRARRAVVEQVRAAHQTLAASRANLARIRDELVPLQLQRRQLAEDAYRAGLTDSTPLFLAEQDVRVAQTQVITVEAQAALALVRLQRAVGGPGVAATLARAERPEGAAPAAEPSPSRTP